MFGLKKIGSSISKTSGYLAGKMKSFGISAGDHFRMKGRIRLANRWASHHPKKFFAIFLISMIPLIVINETIYYLIKKNRQDKSQAVMLDIKPVFDGIHRIDANRERLKIQLNMLIDEGNLMLQQLDSISNLPVKTRNDSIEMKVLMKKIEHITNILSNET